MIISRDFIFLQLYNENYMDYDKYIGGRKLKRMGHTQQQCIEIQRRAILNIRSISESLNSLFEEISMFSPSMVSPTASPIKQHTNSNTTFNNTPIKQFMLAPTFKKQANSKSSQNNPQVKPMKKKSIPSVHFTNYMKPIGNVSQKFKGLLQQQKKLREIEQERELYNINSLKQKANQQYRDVPPKYQQYDQTKSAKEEAIAHRLIERSQSEMSGITFKPKINKNIEINQSFEERLKYNQKVKQLRSTQIIKQAMKGETYHPKINAHKQSESKVKSIWNKQNNKKLSQVGISKSFREQSSQFSQIWSSLPLQSPVKMKNLSQFDFINKK